MEIFRYQGRQLAYVRRGYGEPIVFLHNGGTSHVIWQAQLDALAHEHQVLALDLPGYGRSEAPDAYTLATYTQMLSTFLQLQFGEAAVGLVGNCMGSAIALNYARQQPGRVRALVLINPLTVATFAAGGVGGLLRLRRQWPQLTELMAGGVRRLPMPAAGISPAIKMQLGAQGRALRLWESAALRACYQGPQPMAALTGLFQDLPQYAALDRLAPGLPLPPIHTLWGRQNRILSATAGAELNQTLRPVQALTLDDCGHLLMMERPAAVSEWIRDAVRRKSECGNLVPH